MLKQYRELMLINRWNLSDYESTALWELYRTETRIAIQSTINEQKVVLPNPFIIEKILCH